MSLNTSPDASASPDALDDLSFAPFTDVAELVRTRRVSPVELTRSMLDRIRRHDGTLNSYAVVLEEAASAAALAAERELDRGVYRGPLHGIPVAVKDLCDVAGVPSAAGTVVRADVVPDTDSTVVRRLREAGAVVLGKLRMTEGAYTDHHPDLPTPLNPWDPDTWAGSSSSGSGVATAAGLCFGSLGSDTGGSIRLPSAANGLTGLKPTWGRVSRHGVFELAASLDHVGPMARSAADCAALLAAIAGRDPLDPTALDAPVPDYLGDLGTPVLPRVGIDPSFSSTFDAPTREALDAVVAVLRGLGWTVSDVRLPDVSGVVADWEAHCGIETALAHEATYPARAGEYGTALTHLIEVGRSRSGIDYQRILQRRRDFTGRLRRFFRDVDLVVVPAVGVASPTTAQITSLATDKPLLEAITKPTSPFNVAGNPTITLPCGFTDRGTPIGFQFVATDLGEPLLLQAAHAFQQVTGFHRAHPVLAG
ncbi:amidase [Kineococcus rubinsiae]|uniref:amidase n=1 Tax=Kineococcus rubinsiae TaxID=2609562 RepID=UPI001AD90D3B|nr:amidase [Kineococcus rubinsiae]